jgi:putative membrane protein
MANVPGTDASFVEHMASDGIAEVKLGQLAAERASNAEVKKFAQRMVADHSKAGDELKPVASRLNVKMPVEMDDEHQDLHDRLSKMKGAEFDREYMNAMVDGHEDVLDQLERKANDKVGSRGVGTAGNDADDAAVTAWASKTLPTVRQHLEQAKQIQQKLDNRSTQ